MEASTKYQGQCRKKYKSHFLEKIFIILEDGNFAELVSWNDAGTSFSVTKSLEFAESVLPRFFKHNNFSSFTRQLNMYNFTRYQNQKGIQSFRHPLFLKGRWDLIEKIERKRVFVKTATRPVSEKTQDNFSLGDTNDSLASEHSHQTSKYIKSTNDSRIPQDQGLNCTIDPHSREYEVSNASSQPDASALNAATCADPTDNAAGLFGDLPPHFFKDAIELFCQYASGKVHPTGFENFKLGLEMFLNFEEIDRECEAEFTSLYNKFNDPKGPF